MLRYSARHGEGAWPVEVLDFLSAPKALGFYKTLGVG